MRAVLFLLVPVMVCAAADETLRYSLKWPTGITMGKAELKTTQGGTRSEFELDASLPGIPATGLFSSRMNAAGCTNEFSKKYELGYRKSSERTSVDGTKARRETSNGGKSTFEAGECARDALAYLGLFRKVLSVGDKPKSRRILFGAQYELTMDYPKPAGTDIETVQFHLKGPASQHTFEIDFLRDATRTPLRVRVPLAMGKFVLELVR
jgi:Protein of unknown function (DUF3108)